MTPEVVSTHQNPHVHPALAIWGLEIPVYLFLGGLVAGVMILVATLELRRRRPSGGALEWAPFAAIGLLSAGMFALLLDLENPENLLRFYLAFRPSSPMSWGAWILLLVYPVLALLGLGGLSPSTRAALFDRARGLGRPLGWALRLADRRRRAVLLASIALGAALGLYTGLLLGTLAARVLWNSALLGPLFLVSGVSTGAALLLLFRAGPGEAKLLLRWDTAALALELALLAVMLLSFLTGGDADQRAAEALLGGRYTPWFWSLVVGAGLVTPLLMNLLELGGRARMVVLTPVLVLIGGLALRIVLVAAGQAVSA